MQNALLTAVALLAAAPVCLAQTPFVDSIDAGRGSLPLLVPSTYSPAEPIPLIIALHGFQQDGPEVEGYFRMTGLVEAERFLYVAPSGNKNFLGQGYWNAESACCDIFGNGPDDIGYLTGLIDLIKANYAVDDLRVHFVGYSNGGFMAYRMACNHAATVASIVSLAGATPLDGDPCAPSEPVHVLQVHGTSDGVINYNGGSLPEGSYPGAEDSVLTWALFNGCDPVLSGPGPAFDLASSVGGAETTDRIYDVDCIDNVVSELWTMAGAEHGPPFVGSAAGDGTSNQFSARAIEWLLAHPKPGAAPCPADLNGDGIADNGDIGIFVALFIAQDLSVDLNGDGILDNGDIVSYIEAFLAGCSG